MEDRLNKFKWIMVVFFILWAGWMGLDIFVFNNPDFVSFEDAQKVLIDQYFDKNINETIYVYCFEDVVFYNITNHDLNTDIVVYFNLTSNSELCSNYIRGVAFRCVRENMSEQIKDNETQIRYIALSKPPKTENE